MRSIREDQAIVDRSIYLLRHASYIIYSSSTGDLLDISGGVIRALYEEHIKGWASGELRVLHG